MMPSIFEEEGLANQLAYPLWSPSSLGTASGFDGSPIIRSRKLEDTDVVRHLFHEGGTITNGSPESLETITGIADYTVTSGKTAKLILLLRSNTTDCQFKVWQTDAADDVATGSPVTKYTYAGTDFDSAILMTVCPDWDVTELTFAASKYITIEVTSGSGSLRVMGAAVIES